MMRLLLALAAVWLIALPATAQQMQRDETARLEAEVEDVRAQIEEVELWVQMNEAAAYVPGSSRCKHYLEEAERTRNSLENLNRRYEGRADETYREQAQNLLRENQDMVQEYRSCFGSVVAPRYGRIAQAGVAAYQPFTARYNQLTDKFGDADPGSLFSQLKRQLEDLERQLARLEYDQDIVAGTVTSVWRSVRIVRNGREMPVQVGDRIFVGDQVVTGTYGRIRIEQDNACNRVGTGSSALNIGGGSQVTVNTPGFRGHECERDPTMWEVVSGAVTAYVESRRNTLPASIYVKVGSTVSGVRGTEIAFTRNPARDESGIWLDHGDAFLLAGEREFPLAPGEVTEIRAGQIVQQRRFDPAEYNQLIRATASRGDMSLSEAQAERTQAAADLRARADRVASQSGGRTGEEALALTLSGMADQQTAEQARASLQTHGFDAVSLSAATNVLTADSGLARRQAARRDINALMDAYTRRDWQDVKTYLTERGRTFIDSKLNSPEGPASLLTGGNVPNEYTIDCVTCATTSECLAYMMIRNNGAPTVWTRNIYALEPNPSGRSAWMATGTRDASNEAAFRSAIEACPAF